MLLVIIILLLFLLIFLLSGIRIVPEYERIVILRLGKAQKEAKGPGIVLVIPIIDYPIRVDLRERVFEIAEQFGDIILDDVLSKREEINQKLQMRIMAAERNRRAMITKAEGEKQSQILRAEGYALALSKIYEVAKNIDPNTIALEYLKTLENISKIIISEILSKVKK